LLGLLSAAPRPRTAVGLLSAAPRPRTAASSATTADRCSVRAWLRPRPSPAEMPALSAGKPAAAPNVHFVNALTRAGVSCRMCAMRGSVTCSPAAGAAAVAAGGYRRVGVSTPTASCRVRAPFLPFLPSLLLACTGSSLCLRTCAACPLSRSAFVAPRPCGRPPLFLEILTALLRQDSGVSTSCLEIPFFGVVHVTQRVVEESQAGRHRAEQDVLHPQQRAGDRCTGRVEGRE